MPCAVPSVDCLRCGRPLERIWVRAVRGGTGLAGVLAGFASLEECKPEHAEEPREARDAGDGKPHFGLLTRPSLNPELAESRDAEPDHGHEKADDDKPRHDRLESFAEAQLRLVLVARHASSVSHLVS